MGSREVGYSSTRSKIKFQSKPDFCQLTFVHAWQDMKIAIRPATHADVAVDLAGEVLDRPTLFGMNFFNRATTGY